MNNQLNPYTVTWAVITPTRGKFFKKNLNEISKTIFSIGKMVGQNEAIAHFPTRDRAIELLNKVSASKQFKVVLITDKQFGQSNWKESKLNVATEKQLNDYFIIGQ